MMWGFYRRPDNGTWWLVVLLVIGLMLVGSRGFFGAWWLFFLIPCVFMPAWGRHQRRDRRWRYDEGRYEKPKHDAEKPKRATRSDVRRTLRRDDGETLEVIEDAPPRRDSETFYV